LSNSIERWCTANGIALTVRNRAARRRKRNAFHWIDENWRAIVPVYDEAVVRTLGPPTGAAGASSGRFAIGSAQNPIGINNAQRQATVKAI
jgi:hypothetical protein